MKQPSPPFPNRDVEAAFDAFPEPARGTLIGLRTLIYDVARTTPGVGELEETLKWGQPAYLTPKTKSGSTIRLGIPKDGGFAIYAHCQTTIISDFRHEYPTEFAYEGNRAVRFREGARPDLEKLEVLVRAALTYRRKATSGAR